MKFSNLDWNINCIDLSGVSPSLRKSGEREESRGGSESEMKESEKRSGG